MLDRIVVLLLAIADLAERAAAAPDARRRLVLAIIRKGEASAHDAFCATTAVRNDCQDDAVEDAISLARSLRLLALIVQGIAAPLRRLSLLLAGGIRVGRGPDHNPRALIRRLSLAAFPRARCLDTS